MSTFPYALESVTADVDRATHRLVLKLDEVPCTTLSRREPGEWPLCYVCQEDDFPRHPKWMELLLALRDLTYQEGLALLSNPEEFPDYGVSILDSIGEGFWAGAKTLQEALEIARVRAPELRAAMIESHEARKARAESLSP